MATGQFNHPHADDSPAVLETPDGNINYWIRTTGSPYTETFTRGANSVSVSKVKLIVGWDDAATFKKWSLGFSERDSGSGTRLKRHLPLLNPYTLYQRLDSLTLVQCEADVNGVLTGPEADPLSEDWPQYDWCIYEAYFTSHPYTFLTNDELNASPYLNHEWHRYCTRTPRIIAKEQKYPNYTFETYCPEDLTEVGQPVPQVGFLPFYEQEVIYRLHEWPLDCFPLTYIAERLATVNDNTFDTRYAAGTLLFKGVADITTPYQMPDGNWAVDWSAVFGYQPNGWNYYRGLDKVYRPIRVAPIEATGGSGSGSGCLSTLEVVVDRNTPIHPYSESDLTYIFRPGLGI